MTAKKPPAAKPKPAPKSPLPKARPSAAKAGAAKAGAAKAGAKARSAPTTRSRARKETLTRPFEAEAVGGEPSPDSRAAPPTGKGGDGPAPTRREGKRARAERLDPDPAVVAQIRELEAQLDRLIDEASRRDLGSLDPEGGADDDAELTVDDAPRGVRGGSPGADHDDDHSDLEETQTGYDRFDAEETVRVARSPEPSSRAASGPLSTPYAGAAGVPPPPESVFDTARELLSTDFYLRKWGRLAMRGRSEEVDDFGFDPTYDAKLRPMLDFLYTKYFRIETSGIDGIPREGRCVLVANHSGTLPLDGVMLKTAVKREHAAERDLRWLTEDFIYHMPFLGGAMNRLGAVRACQENAERLLANEELVAVFPEGVKGIGKLFGERYRLQRFGRGGFIKLCLRTSTPVVPVAILGAEETNPMLFRIEHLSKALGVPYMPVTPTFPLLGPLGLLPAPTKWRMIFGEPLDLSSHGPEAADDEILVGKLAERVRASIQGMLDRAVGSRKSVFFG